MAIRLVRVVCAAYWGYLTILLLTAHPAHFRESASTPGVRLVMTQVPDSGVHFACLGLLAVLAHASRFGLRPATLVGLLIGYGALTETLQWLVPFRAVELRDYLENSLGVLAGSAAWWWATHFVAKWTLAASQRLPKGVVTRRLSEPAVSA